MRVKMKQFASRFSCPPAPPRAAPDLERLFGVQGMAAGRKIAPRRLLGLMAHDIPAREQAHIALQFAALGLVPPAALGAVMLAWNWVWAWGRNGF